MDLKALVDRAKGIFVHGAGGERVTDRVSVPSDVAETSESQADTANDAAYSRGDRDDG